MATSPNATAEATENADAEQCIAEPLHGLGPNEVFDGENMRPRTSVRFEGGVITHCTEQPAVMLDDEVVDADGGTLLPGLIDAHIHLVPGALEQSLTFGVTTVLDMFSKPDTVTAAKDRATRSGAADVRSSGIGATAPGGHPSLMYALFPTVTGPEQAAGFVADRIAEGADYLKVIAESGVSGAFTRPGLDAVLDTTDHEAPGPSSGPS